MYSQLRVIFKNAGEVDRWLTLAYTLLLYLSLYSRCEAQNTVETLPVQMGSWIPAMPLINPSSISLDKKWEILIGTQRHFGLFNAFSTSYASASYLLREKGIIPSRSQNRIGINLYTDQSGGLINKSALYGVYAWQMPLSDAVYLRAGASLGFVSYTIKPSGNNGGFADTKPDAYLGLMLRTDKLDIGIGLGHIFNSSLQPVQEIQRLTPHTNIQIQYNYTSSPYFVVQPSMLLRVSTPLAPDLDLGISTIYKKYFRIALNYRHQKGIMLTTSLRGMDIGTFKARFGLSYMISFAPISVPQNRYEVFGGAYESIRIDE